MEYFDVLNEDGNPTGRTKPRSEVHRDGDWHRAVHVWIVNARGGLLVQKRSSLVENHPDKWDISSAGHVAAGDTAIATAIREVQEELGIKLAEKDFTHLFTVKAQTILPEIHFYNNEFDEVYLVRRDLDSATLRIDPKEVSEVKLVPFAELERMIAEKPHEFVAHPEEYRRLFAYLRIAGIPHL